MNSNHNNDTFIYMDKNGSNNTTPAMLEVGNVVAFHVVFLILAFMIVLANSIILTVYFKTRPLHTSNNHLLVSLAFTDLFAGLVNIPLISLSALVVASEKHIIALNFSVTVVSDFVVTVNELNLFLIFLDRYLVICHPLGSRKLLTRKRRLRAIVITWIIAATVAFIPLFWCFKVVSGQEHSESYSITMNNIISYHSIAVSVCCFILPSIVMLFFLISMIDSLRKQKKKRKNRLKIGRDDSKFRAYHKAFCMLSAMYVLMLVAWSPLMIVRLCMDIQVRLNIPERALDCLMLIRFFTAFVNPFIYTFIKQEFRKAFFMKLRCF